MTSIQNGSLKKKLKLLCMHGFGTNKEFMRMQTEILRKDLEEIAELIYVDGPYEVPLDFISDPKVLNNLKGSPRSWFQFGTNKTKKIEEIIKQQQKVRQSIESSSDYYDGALCFSQGAYTIQFILWYHAKGYLNWPIIKNIKFFINFSSDSFRISLKDLDYHRLELPSLHFLSEEDFLFRTCLVSPTLFKNPEIIYHSFGHRFPVLGIREKAKLRGFLRRHGFKESSSKGQEINSKL